MMSSSSRNISHNWYQADQYSVCSAFSGSYNETVSDLPGPGRMIGKVYMRLGHSLENVLSNLKGGRKRTVKQGSEISENASSEASDWEEIAFLESTESLSELTDVAEDECTDSNSSQNVSEENITWDASSSLDIASSDTQYTTCSLISSSNYTTSNLPGPGRLLGRVYAYLGSSLETHLNQLAMQRGRGPDALLARLCAVLKKLLWQSFLIHFDDLDGKIQRELKKSCVEMIGSNVHATQISALFGIIELSAKYPVARECLNDLDTESVIRRVPLTVNQNTSDTRDVIELATLCRRCQICLKETEVYGLWRKFFLAGDAYEREKVALQMLSFVSNSELSCVAIRSLTSILRRPLADSDFSESIWVELLHSMEEIARSSEHNDLTALDELFQAALERVSNFLGRFSVGFSCEGGVLMRFVRALQTQSETRYPNAVGFASMLIAPRNRLRVRRSTL